MQYTLWDRKVIQKSLKKDPESAKQPKLSIFDNLVACFVVFFSDEEQNNYPVRFQRERKVKNFSEKKPKQT